MPFNLAAFARKITAAVASHGPRGERTAVGGVFEIADEDLGCEAAVGEDEGLLSAFEKAESEATGLGDVAAPDAKLLVHNRRIVEGEVAFALGCAVRFDFGDRLFDEFLRKLFRIGDGGRAADEAWLGTVEIADSL